MDFETDAVTTTKADLDSLAAITGELDRLEGELSAAEALVESITDRIKHLRMSALPDALLAAKLPSVTTDSGIVITRKQIVAGSFPKEEDPVAVAAAVRWLRDNKLEDLMKATIKIDFNKGDIEQADKVLAAIRALPQANSFKDLSLKESVHPQTLNAMLRERMAEGKETPLELFNGYTAWIAEIVKPGKKKGKK